MAAPTFICANWAPERSECGKDGRYTCKNCRLVTYCGPTCQKSHWPQHKPECRSTLGRETWQPSWVLERRTPSFIGGGLAEHFGVKKYLWGNVPALDILQLESNEGEGYAGDLRILFADSGDFRNVVKTVAQLPSSYSNSLEVTINDRDFDIVSRNIILLLIALVVEEVDEAIDCIIHVWYSALVRESDTKILQHRIRPLIEDVCVKVKGNTSGGLFGKAWTFGQRSLRVVCDKSSWIRLLSIVDKPIGLTADQAHKIRTATTLAEPRRDYRERQMCCLSPPRRIAYDSFGRMACCFHSGFRAMNSRNQTRKTLFQTSNAWPMKDDANPLHGWSSEEITNTSSGPATADVYGKLFYFLRGLLRSFLDRISSLNIAFKLFQMDASSLPDHLEANAFSRIDVSNISDAGWLGIHRTLYLTVPLLQTPLENRHATLITLFMNAVEETLTDEDRKSGMAHRPTTETLLKYLPLKRMPVSGHDPEFMRFTVAWDLVTTHDHIFDRYSREYKLCDTAKFCGATMKEKHTVVGKWPFRLKLRPGQPGAQDEFDERLGGGTSSKERYVEWKRVHQGVL